MELFEISSKNKYRYAFRGMITTEDLWDLSMSQLDTIYKDLSKRRKTEQEEESLMTDKEVNSDLVNMIEIVKHVFSVKKDEVEREKNAAEKKKKKEKLLEILARKQDESLEEKSEEEILKMISDL